MAKSSELTEIFGHHGLSEDKWQLTFDGETSRARNTCMDCGSAFELRRVRELLPFRIDWIPVNEMSPIWSQSCDLLR